MRRVVTALVLVVAAMTIVACSGGQPTDTGTVTPTTPTAPVAQPGGSAPATSTDVLSPVETVAPGEMFPTDKGSVPSAVLANLTAKKPMLVYFFDPTTKVAANQRKHIDSALRGYSGKIELVTFDYTVGLPSGGAAAAPSEEVAKAELMAGLLKVDTTPYIIFVDAEGRITYRFSGFVDRELLEREVLRATE